MYFSKCAQVNQEMAFLKMLSTQIKYPKEVRTILDKFETKYYAQPYYIATVFFSKIFKHFIEKRDCYTIFKKIQ